MIWYFLLENVCKYEENLPVIKECTLYSIFFMPCFVWFFPPSSIFMAPLWLSSDLPSFYEDHKNNTY